MNKSYSRSFINSVPDKENNVNSTNVTNSDKFGLINKFKRQVSSKEGMTSTVACSNEIFSSMSQIGGQASLNDSSKAKCNTLPDSYAISSSLYTNRSGDYSREILRKLSGQNSNNNSNNNPTCVATSNASVSTNVEKNQSKAGAKLTDRESMNTSANYYFSDKASVLNANSVKNTSSSINLSTSSSSSSCSSQNKNQLRENLSVKNSKKVEKYLADISEKGSKKGEGCNNSNGNAAAAIAPCIKKEKPKDFAHPQQLINKIQLNASASKPKEGLSYKEFESDKITQMYSKEIIETLKLKDKETFPRNSLENHKIPANLRAKMVDWMIEVLSSYKCDDQTFFMAVNIMDQFFKKSKKSQEISDLHLIGVTSMFISSKYEEIYPLKLSVVHEKISHKKLSVEQIKQKESEIMQAINFSLTDSTLFEFLMLTLQSLNLKEITSKKYYTYLQKVCIYLAKMAIIDYELYNKQNTYELTAAIIFVAFKIIEQLDKSFPIDMKTNETKKLLGISDKVFYDSASNILSVAKNFEKMYPNLENLKKFNGFSLDEEQNKSNPSKKE